MSCKESGSSLKGPWEFMNTAAGKILAREVTSEDAPRLLQRRSFKTELWSGVSEMGGAVRPVCWWVSPPELDRLFYKELGITVCTSCSFIQLRLVLQSQTGGAGSQERNFLRL